MYSSKRAKNIPTDLDLDYILTRVSEYDIYARYMGQFKVGGIYNCPFRKDNSPSFGVYYSKKNGKLLFKDHGSGVCGDVIKFVGEMTSLTNYKDILARIVKDMSIKNSSKATTTTQYVPQKETIISIVRQPFTERDLQYWMQFGITEATLNKYNVFSIQYYLSNGIVKGVYRDDYPMYAYQVYDRFKIYRPLNDKLTKWRNNLTNYDIQGYNQLPETGDLLVITKSMKDVMSFHEMGINAITPSSESSFIPDEIMEILKKRFKRIVIMFDRDKAGVSHVWKLYRKYGFECVFMHKKYKEKDLSDGIKSHGFQEIKNFIYKTLKL